ncbi:MAG: aminoacyl-histidine dipeptidase [Bacteroidota bacterium]|nr:aminoacyl-histidine dipeptidase [Bacteroidota bacterium]
MKDIASLQPERIWHYFMEICNIPHPSKKEAKLATHLLKFGQSLGLESIQDATGNILIRKPASAGMESGTPVILQSHIDMVCEKNSDIVHDFEKDPIVPWIDGDWVKAKGTTLGSDDGIGIAAMMAILESKEITHGPLECLFTVDEETGLTGAFGIKPDLLKGKILLNLDSEDEGQMFIGCAGGKDTVATMDRETGIVPADVTGYQIRLSGLKGGHSGDDIHKGLGNAVKLLNRFLWNATRDFYLRVYEINAGNLRNAIAREGSAWVVVPDEQTEGFEAYSELYKETIREELKVTEPGLQFTVKETGLPPNLLAPDTEFMLLNSLYACPHGVVEFSREIPGFVETSTNLASVKFTDDKILITTSQRSSVDTAKTDIADQVASVFMMAGADIEHSTGYPGWNPNPDSKVLKICVESYRKLFSEEPKVLAIHAGLECGLIGAIYPGMDMISFGPTIKGAHSPDERLDIKSTQKFWDLLTDVLKQL